MAVYYWIGGSGNWSSGTKWSTSSGGSAANATPTSADDVVFDDSSSTGTFTVTVDVAASCRDFTCSITNTAYKMTLARSAAVNLSVYGSWSNPGSTLFAWSGSSGTHVFASTATGKTILTNGVTIPTAVTFDGVGGGWSLSSALTCGTTTSHAFTVTNGALNLNGYNVTGSGNFTASGSSTCSVDASDSGGRTPTLTFYGWSAAGTGLTFTRGVSQISLTNVNPIFYGGGRTYYNLTFTATAPGTTGAMTGANTFNNLTIGTRSDSSLGAISLADNITVSSTLSLQSGNTDPTKRFMLYSATLGTAKTVTVAAMSADCIDLRDITIAGAAATYNGSAKYFGDCGGNSGVTFPTPKTVYWGTLSGSQNWQAVGWATSSGGTPANANFPLPQDTAVINDSSTATTITCYGAPWNVGMIDCSGRTSALTLACPVYGFVIYGDASLPPAITMTGSPVVRFSKRGGTQSVTINNSSPWRFAFQNVGGTIQLVANLTSTHTTNHDFLAGTLDLNGKTLSVVGFTSSGSVSRTLAFGASGVLTLSAATTTAFSASGSNQNVSGTGKISFTSASSKTGAFGGFSYSGISISQEGAGALTISGSNTLGDITNTTAGYGSSVLLTSGTTQTVENFTLSGTTGNRITLSATSTTAATMSKASGSVSVSSLNISKSTVTGGATWKAFATNDNIDSGTNTGWFFTDPTNFTASSVSTAAPQITTAVFGIKLTAVGISTTAPALSNPVINPAPAFTTAGLTTGTAAISTPTFSKLVTIYADSLTTGYAPALDNPVLIHITEKNLTASSLVTAAAEVGLIAPGFVGIVAGTVSVSIRQVFEASLSVR